MTFDRILNDGPTEYEHYIEESVSLYLQRDPSGKTNTWHIDPTCLDGDVLWSNYDNGPVNANCECGDEDECDRITRIMGEKADFPTAKEAMFMLAEALGYTVTKSTEKPILEVIDVRDPDGYESEPDMFLDGEKISEDGPVKIHYYEIDAGAGHEWEDWKAHRDESLANASPAVREKLRAAFDNPPGSHCITGKPDDEPWV
ncbi:hypothetical protein CJ179_38540 [Rhodococcus sp. ACS1]|uniref:hypothetical protein n=1 Tax=Rhodococcus sp. ACS1 TaxID=2028570 RepID=UPI000BB1204E|nr:hypothetical protein [Rhodococcus sp. ACS1]PBC38499.1 hypothetical protein CJ179_38540 [Rhodococcus sp. ACS1]